VREEWSRAWCGARGKWGGEGLSLCFSAKSALGDMVSGVEKPRRPDTVGAGGGLMQREPAGTATEVAQLASSLDALEKNLAGWAMGRSNRGVHCSSGPRPLIPFPFIQLFSIISK
jgi:hypothetical protein